MTTSQKANLTKFAFGDFRFEYFNLLTFRKKNQSSASPLFKRCLMKNEGRNAMQLYPDFTELS